MTENFDADSPDAQEERALRAIEAIAGGADITDEATKLSNEFTDRHWARLRGWFRR